jgi:hypothetical protein
LGHADTANARIILDSRREEANEKSDRAWRRWRHFLNELGLADDPFLADLSSNESELVVRAFLCFYRSAQFAVSGKSTGKRVKPLVCGTVRDAASSLAAAFRDNLGPSPFHNKNTAVLLPSIRRLFKAFDNLDPPKRRQKAITPKFLRKLFAASGAGYEKFCNAAPAICADIAIAAWFFAMRGCESTHSTTPGKTLPIRIADVTFRDTQKRLIPNSSPRIFKAEYVTVTFRDQKNGRKLEARSMRRTGDSVLCPIIRWASIIDRLLHMNYKQTTNIFCFTPDGKHQHTITTKFFVDTIKTACTVLGGKAEFGFGASEIGAKSIRSGAAMALFLSDVPVAKIMILGRWMSDAFLDYIRPQVLEWTSDMSLSMTNVEHFLDVSDAATTNPADPKTRNKRNNINGSTFLLPRFHLHH